jgi:hypothetical protein
MGSSLDKFYTIFSNFLDFQIFVNTEDVKMRGEPKEFENYLQNINQSRIDCKNSSFSHITKSKFLKCKISIEDDEGIDKTHKGGSVKTAIRNKIKDYFSKSYSNDISEKEYFVRKILNKSINRKMRLIRDQVNNISTRDSCKEIYENDSQFDTIKFKS